MSDKFEDWFDSAVDKELFKLTAPSAQYHAAKAAWAAAIESQKEERFACHIDEKIGEIYYDCGFDYLKDSSACPEVEHLRFMGKTKTDCEYWREIK